VITKLAVIAELILRFEVVQPPMPCYLHSDRGVNLSHFAVCHGQGFISSTLLIRSSIAIVIEESLRQMLVILFSRLRRFSTRPKSDKFILITGNRRFELLEFCLGVCAAMRCCCSESCESRPRRMTYSPSDLTLVARRSA